MELLKAALLGLVEGLTEFLPVSSTGHLILVNELLKLAGSAKFVSSFEVIIQLGAILAVVWLYFGELWPFGQKETHQKIWQTWFLVLVATIPAFILGFLLDDWIERYLFNPWVVGIALVFYGIVLLIVEILGKSRFEKGQPLERLSWQRAFGIGVFQCLALIPGTSRSLATILGGLLLGLSRESAARFSFFVAIPIMVGASGLKLIKHANTFSLQEIGVLGVGFWSSFLVAWLAVKGLMRYIQRHDFKVFGYYRIALGIVVVLILGVMT